jgi:4-hydroxy-2-oxoheptanedioate aldolase
MQFMRENKIKTIWGRGGWVLNGWCTIPSGFAAELMASLGWDSVTVDMQHGVVDYRDSVAMFQAISTTDAAPMARVPWNDPAHIMKALDAGAYGIICPMVNTRAEAEKFAGAMRYAPVGYRSSGPIRASLYGGPDYMEKANDTLIALAMIETAEAMANLDAIAATPGVDALYVGPSDLSISLGGKPGLDQTADKVVTAINAIVAAAKRHGKRVGIQCGSTAYAKKAVKDGFDLVTVLSDSRLIAALGAQTVKDMRAG